MQFPCDWESEDFFLEAGIKASACLIHHCSLCHSKLICIATLSHGKLKTNTDKFLFSPRPGNYFSKTFKF